MRRAVFTVVAAALTLACKSDEGGQPRPAAMIAQPTPSSPADAAPPSSPPVPELPPPRALQPVPLGLPERPDPEHNPITAAKVSFGRLLFFDPRLSRSGKTSCSSCHRPENGYASPEPTQTDPGRRNGRDVPTLWNTAHSDQWPWDGATDVLENQILGHMRGQLGREPASAAEVISQIPAYRAHAARSFGATSAPTARHLAMALASFVRTREIGGSPWDRYEAGDRGAVSADAIAGFAVFREVAQCAICHVPPLYTDHRFYALGVSTETTDPGRARATGEAADARAFRTPTLRGLGATAPYFHDGSAPTLEEVVERKLAAGIVTGNPSVDRRLTAVRLDPRQRRQLLAFLRSLSPVAPSPAIERPTLPIASATDGGIEPLGATSP